ncbi:hypothetical protein STRTUCAR8_09931 [Streptomyces turgidiscabies Car8]|uniref:MmyB-like transcription regulator ligand binding domain-containing protein n=1 Tax=Streptomyces turgidiscabies (strain Car8) TaxID=698760 RepID=L7ET47_STRT8|nr:hypothetical protein STRTUCAR8_09931 [Streptomyces turgidiscabies Car8]
MVDVENPRTARPLVLDDLLGSSHAPVRQAGARLRAEGPWSRLVRRRSPHHLTKGACRWRRSSRRSGGMVSELRAAAARYPADRQLQRLTAELCAGSERFTELGKAGVVGSLEVSRRTVEHPRVGLLTLDCQGSRAHVGAVRWVSVEECQPRQRAGRVQRLGVKGVD